MSETPNLPTPQPPGIAFVYNDQQVFFDENRFIDMTQMWRAAGSPTSRKPSEWRRQSSAEEFVQDLARSLGVSVSGLWKTRRGQGIAGTWGHWQIALAYARYLSPEFHRFVNEAFREWAEEKVDPDLKAQRAIGGYRKQGRDDSWIMNRLEGIIQRNRFTDALKNHGVAEVGYAHCTDAINKEVLGGTAREIKVSRGLAPSHKTRDHLDTLELAALRFAEAMAEKGVNDECAHGNAECCRICGKAGAATYEAMASMGLVAKRA